MSQSRLVTLSTLSTEYVCVGFQYTSIAELTSDPTLLPVQMAFKLPDVTPDPAMDFKTAAWRVEDDKTIIICLVGPLGDAVLSVGFYNVWIKITGNPEVIIKMAGSITVE